MGMRAIMLGTRRTGGGNESSKGENFRIGAELMNYNWGEGQKTISCLFLVMV